MQDVQICGRKKILEHTKADTRRKTKMLDRRPEEKVGLRLGLKELARKKRKGR